MSKQRYMSLIESMRECLKVAGTGLPGSEDVGEKVQHAFAEAKILLKGVCVDHEDPDSEIPGRTDVFLALLDARLIALASAVIVKCMNGIDANEDTFSSGTFAESLNLYLMDSPLFASVGILDWSKLDAHTGRCFRHAPAYDYVLGTFVEGDIPPKERRTREAPEKVDSSKMKKPENVKTAEKDESGIEETVAKIAECLKNAWKANGKKPLCYFKFVVDPASYAWTVENMFHLSFLIKDNRVEFGFDTNGLPVISHIRLKSGAAPAPTNAFKNTQMLVSLDPPEWRAIVKSFGIKKAMIVVERPTVNDASTKKK